MPGGRYNTDAYRMIPVLLCVFLFGALNGVNAQFKPCETNGRGRITIDAHPPDVKPVRILEMPNAEHTEAARDAGIYGIVKLKVRFLAGGRIGYVNVLSELPDGLTGEAVRAAKKIRFGPARQNARMIHAEHIVEYEFFDPAKCVPGTAAVIK